MDMNHTYMNCTFLLSNLTQPLLSCNDDKTHINVIVVFKTITALFTNTLQKYSGHIIENVSVSVTRVQPSELQYCSGRFTFSWWLNHKHKSIQGSHYILVLKFKDFSRSFKYPEVSFSRTNSRRKFTSWTVLKQHVISISVITGQF